MTAPTTTRPAPTVDPRDCDRCGARARTRVVLPAGTDLLFCGHHTHQYELRLIADGATLIALA